MFANHLDEFILLLIIASSFLGIIAYYCYIKKHIGAFYQSEKAYFSGHSVSLKPQSLSDICAYILLFIIIGFLIWNNFFPIGFKHFDTILTFDELTCNLKIFPIQINWQNRFVPFSQQEWSALSPILTLSNCTAYIPFFLITLQFIATVFLLINIIPFEKIAFKLIATSIIIVNSSFLIPFNNVMIPDRNTLFLIILFLYCLINFFKTEKPIYLLFAFICANIALYYKEPISIYLSAFAGTSLLFKLYHRQISFADIPLSLIRKTPIEFLLIFISILFLTLYVVFNFIVFDIDTTYGANQTNYGDYLITQFARYPLFLMIIVMGLAYIIDYKNLAKQKFSVMLFIGGLSYALAIIYLKFSHLYYFGIAEMSILLAACYYLKNMAWQKNLKWQKNTWQVFTMLIVAFMIFDAVKSVQNLTNDIQTEKIQQYQMRAFKNNLPLDVTKINKIFHYSVPSSNDDDSAYAVSNHFLMLKNITPTYDFHLSSFQPCYKRDLEKQTTQLKCIQTDKWQPDAYDFTIFWRNRIDDATWQSLQAQYGDNMQQITNFPSWLGDTTRYNIYVLQQ